jgi:hypothetical protein
MYRVLCDRHESPASIDSRSSRPALAGPIRGRRDLTLFVSQDGRANIDVLANDGVEESAFVFSVFPGQFSERVVINGDGTLHYRPLPGFLGEDGFVNVVDIKGEKAEGRVVIFVRPFEEILTATPDTAIVARGQGTVLAVLANDDYLGTRPVSISGITEQRFDSRVLILSDGQIFYRSAPDFVGEDRFFYTWADDLEHRARVSVSIFADEFLLRGIAKDDESSGFEGRRLEIRVLGNDHLIGSVSDVVVSPAWHGVTAWNKRDNLVAYTPNPGYVGPDAFAYSVIDGSGHRSSAVVDVTVKAYNAPPEAVADSVSVISQRGLVIPVLANDRDVEGDELRLVSVGATEKGALVLQNVDGSVFYRAGPHILGPDRFTYTMEDALGNSSESYVALFMTEDASAPLARDDEGVVAPFGRINIPVLANDTFFTDSVRVVSVTQGRHSALVIANSDQTIHYRAGESYEGSDVFTYTIADRLGKMASAVVRVRSTATRMGDFDGDDRVGFADFLMFAAQFGLAQSDLIFDDRMDFDADGKIGFADFLQFIRVYGT